MAMQYTLKNLFLTGCIAASLAHAASDDTTAVYQSPAVTVTATRTMFPVQNAVAPVQVITGATMQERMATTVADVLQTVNGMTIQDYGATGGLKQPTYRGLSSANVLILMNGIPINEVQYGSIDLSLLPIGAVDRIEVASGGASALYGGDAAGGVVNIITRHASDEFHAHVQGDAGSFGRESVNAEVQDRLEGVGVILGASNESGNDDFSFINHRLGLSDTTMTRQNADYRRTTAYWNGDYQWGTSIGLNSSIQYVQFDRGVPGSLDFPTNARQNDGLFHGTGDATISINEDILWKINGIYDQSNELYHDTLRYTYFSKNVFLHSQVEWTAANWDRIVGGIEYGDAHLLAHGYSILYDSFWNVEGVVPNFITPVRIQKSTYVSNEITVQNEAEWFDRFIFIQSGRYDGYSDVHQNAFSPKFGMNIRLNKTYDVHIRSSVGRNFRVPTFNDLYYPSYSNPQLAPEHITSFDGGIFGNLEAAGRQTIQVTYFTMVTKDKIVLDPSFIPYNIGKADNTGIEVRYDYHSSNGVCDLYFAYSSVDAKNRDQENTPTYGKQLPYVPKSSGTLGFVCAVEIGKIGFEESLVGTRFTDAVNAQSLPAYALTNVNFSKTFPLSSTKMTVRCIVQNLFDVDYQSYPSYPMPGRSVRVSAEVEY
jgi:vitamin B12 transporter